MEELLLPIYGISAAGEIEQEAKCIKWRSQCNAMAANVGAMQNGVRKEFLLISSQGR
jgi:roadblock/LC7 domain-containing protein